MANRIYADLQKTDKSRRLVLTTDGTRRDLAKQGIELKDGLRLSFYSDDGDAAGNRDDLVYEGIVRFDANANRWVAEIDWDAVKHESEL